MIWLTRSSQDPLTAKCLYEQGWVLKNKSFYKKKGGHGKEIESNEGFVLPFAWLQEL
jgi:hypothetical protein